MQVIYTAEDGTHFENEAECLGWERFNMLRKEAISFNNDDGEEIRAFRAFVNKMRYGMDEIWRERKHLYRMVELMKQAEVN